MEKDPSSTSASSAHVSTTSHKKSSICVVAEKGDIHELLLLPETKRILRDSGVHLRWSFRQLPNVALGYIPSSSHLIPFPNRSAFLFINRNGRLIQASLNPSSSNYQFQPLALPSTAYQGRPSIASRGSSAVDYLVVLRDSKCVLHLFELHYDNSKSTVTYRTILGPSQSHPILIPASYSPDTKSGDTTQAIELVVTEGGQIRIHCHSITHTNGLTHSTMFNGPLNHSSSPLHLRKSLSHLLQRNQSRDLTNCIAITPPKNLVLGNAKT